MNTRTKKRARWWMIRLSAAVGMTAAMATTAKGLAVDRQRVDVGPKTGLQKTVVFNWKEGITTWELMVLAESGWRHKAGSQKPGDWNPPGQSYWRWVLRNGNKALVITGRETPQGWMQSWAPNEAFRGLLVPEIWKRGGNLPEFAITGAKQNVAYWVEADPVSGAVCVRSNEGIRLTSVFNDSPVVSRWAAVGQGAEKVTLSSTQGETITVTAAEAGEYQIEATRLDNGQPTETKVTVCVAFAEVSLTSVEQTGSPNFAPGRICINAQKQYSKAQWNISAKPDYLLVYISPASENIGLDKNYAGNGEIVEVTPVGQSVGKYKIKFVGLNSTGLEPLTCVGEIAEYVFRIILDSKSVSTASGTTGNAQAGEFFVRQTADSGGKLHAANLEIKRTSKFITDPSNLFNGFVEAKIRVTEEFIDGMPGYALLIYDEAMPDIGLRLNIPVKFGTIEVGLADVDQFGRVFSIFKGETRVETSNDMVASPTAMTVASQSELPLYRFQITKSISTTSSVTSHVHRFQVNIDDDQGSRLIGYSEGTVVGGYADQMAPPGIYRSSGDVFFKRKAAMEIAGGITIVP